MDPAQNASKLSVTDGKNSNRIDVLFVCDEWKSSKGGLSTLNRELAVNLARISLDSFNIHCYVIQSDEQDRKNARQDQVNLITAQKIPGSTDPVDSLKIPPDLPQLDIVIGHGRKFGLPAYFISKHACCKWIQFVHVFCEDLGKHKKSKRPTEDTIDENENKHKCEIELCEVADLVVGVGSSLQSKYCACLPDIDVQVLTPGIFDSFSCQPVRHFRELRSVNEGSLATEAEQFSVFVFGRVSTEDLRVKGFDIIAKAIASLGDGFKLTVVGSAKGQQRKIEKWLLKKTKITRDQLTIRRYCDQIEMKRMLQQAHLVALPSRAEGFGLVALEAISAGIPVLVSRQSGISTALRQKVENADSVIVSSHDPVEWARRIKELAQQSPQERSKNAICLRENYKAAYPWSTECERFKRIIDVLCKAKGIESNKENIYRPSQEVSSSTEKRTHGKGKRPLSAAERTDDLQSKRRRLEVIQLDPALLQRQLWWHLGQLFGFRSGESQQLKWGDVSLEKDTTTGNERLVLKAEHGKKPRRVFQPVAQTSADALQCPVKLYKEFRSHRPEKMNKPDSPFYLAVKQRRKPWDRVWYMTKQLAMSKIGK